MLADNGGKKVFITNLTSFTDTESMCFLVVFFLFWLSVAVAVGGTHKNEKKGHYTPIHHPKIFYDYGFCLTKMEKSGMMGVESGTIAKW